MEGKKMSIFTRLKNVIMADLHDLLNEQEQRNPIALLNEYLRQCEKEVEKVQKLIERQRLLKQELLREYNHAEHLKEKRKYQAEIALKAHEEELHQFAINEQQQYEERASKLKQALEQATKQLIDLEHKYEEMKHKLKDMHIKRMELMGRENIARAYSRINQVLEQHNSEKNHFVRFAEIENYLDELENRINNRYDTLTFDARIAKLEKELKNQETDSNS
jgi:lia operon protein LiaH